MPIYEYTYMVGVHPLVPDAETASNTDLGEALAKLFGEAGERMTVAIPEFPDDGWEAVSHDVIQIGHKLVITTLIRRAT